MIAPYLLIGACLLRGVHGRQHAPAAAWARAFPAILCGRSFDELACFVAEESASVCAVNTAPSTCSCICLFRIYSGAQMAGTANVARPCQAGSSHDQLFN